MHLISYGDRFTVFSPATDEQTQTLLGLMALLTRQSNAGEAINWEIAMAALRMLRTVEGLGWDFQELAKHQDVIQSLLIGPEAQLLALHAVTPRERSKDKDNDPEAITMENLPFPSSGDSRCDRIASLVHSGWAVSEIRELSSWLTSDEVDAVLYSTYELGRGEKRLEDELWKFRDSVDEQMQEQGVTHWTRLDEVDENGVATMRKVNSTDALGDND